MDGVTLLEKRGMVITATFNNISVIWWWSFLLLEETRVPGENHRIVTSYLQTLSHNVELSIPRLSGIRTHTDYIGSYKLLSNYHTIMTTMAPYLSRTTVPTKHSTNKLGWS